MAIPQDRLRRLPELDKEINALEYRGRIFNDISVGNRNILSDVDKLKRFVERQESYIKDTIMGDLENALTYLHFIKTSTEVEGELIKDKVKEKKREMEILKSKRL